MAVSSSASTAKANAPTLLSKIEAGTGAVNCVSIISDRENSVISASDDKTVRVWVKRENNQYWPSVIQSFPAACSAMHYEQETDGDGHRVFVGLGNGQIQEFRLSNDLNRFERKRTFQSHTNRVTELKLVSEHDWILSTSRDKRFQWSCASTGRSLGTYETSAWCLALEYDEKAKYAFVAEYNGNISVLQLDENRSCLNKITVLSGHSGSVWALDYDPEQRILFSGGFDSTIVVWDIGSQQGTAYELTGHTKKIVCLRYSTQVRKLLSYGVDGQLWVWDLNKEREETPVWDKSDRCKMCNSSFFWNFRGMWNDKSIPSQLILRQHHCRKCGIAVCNSCSSNSSVLPVMGFEIPVRMCEDCHSTITTEDRVPFACSFRMKSDISSICLHHDQLLMVTGSSDDKAINIWDITELQ